MVEGPSFTYLNKPDDGTCDYCGSLMPDAFMERLEAGTIKLGPTDKNYKVYVDNVGGKPFLRTHRIDQPSKPGEIMKDPRDQAHWVWITDENNHCKFYFQHLNEVQQKRFVQLLNEKKIMIGVPGHFYVRPFFIEV